VSLFTGLSDNQSQILVDLAAALGTDPQWLWELLNFESGHDPKAYNASSGAVGLIQFMPRTLKGLGLLSASLASQVPDTGTVPATVKQAVRAEFTTRFPTWEAQMQGPVKTYFEKAPVRPPYRTRQALYMKVFYPAAATVDPATTFATLYQRYEGAEWEDKLEAFYRQNPKIKTVGDYVNKAQALAMKKATRPQIAFGLGAIGMLAAASLLFVFQGGRS
jgi:hypothetical protein